MTAVRINLLSGPRNISTAMMYSFRQRADTSVVDEPLYAYYLTRSGAIHPGRDDVLASQDHDGEAVVRDVILADHPARVRFFKNMAHHVRGLDRVFLEACVNIILTREPRDMLRSLTIQVPDATLDGTGLPMQVELLEDILARGREPIVVESQALLQDPARVLASLCERIGIGFDSTMLSWPPGPKPEDGIWASHWYDNVHMSTGFAPYRPRMDPFPARLEPLLAQAAPLYDRLTQFAITPA
ncbi:MAG: sulfotransferase family protein [Acidimicrobiia bacterium]|nr:sulfotransferase family protein [Acidimicrobiia bacterium]